MGNGRLRMNTFPGMSVKNCGWRKHLQNMIHLFQINAEALRRVQPKELDASEIEVRLGAPWIKAEYINRFMAEIFHTPAYRLGKSINVTYAKINGQWNISGKHRILEIL